MTARIICLGNSTLDRIWPVSKLPLASGKHRASGYLEVGGGMAATAAVAAARLGATVSFWGRAGDDAAGHAMKNEMAGYGVDVTNFRLFTGSRSSISAVLVAADGERTIVNFPGENLPGSPDWLPLSQVSGCGAVLADIRWVAGAHAMFTRARAEGIPTVLDGEIADAAAFSTVLPVVDHAIFSEPGLRAWAGDPMLAAPDYPAVLAKVRRTAGCGLAAVTRGGKGTLWLDHDGLHELPSFAVQVVDTTGAGDVMHGAYTLAIAEGARIPEAMRFASAVAALKCTRQGGRAGIPLRTEVNSFLAQHM